MWMWNGGTVEQSSQANQADHQDGVTVGGRCTLPGE